MISLPRQAERSCHLITPPVPNVQIDRPSPKILTTNECRADGEGRCGRYHLTLVGPNERNTTIWSLPAGSASCLPRHHSRHRQYLTVILIYIVHYYGRVTAQRKNTPAHPNQSTACTIDFGIASIQPVSIMIYYQLQLANGIALLHGDNRPRKAKYRTTHIFQSCTRTRDNK